MPFLVKYQTDEPIIMFLAEELHDVWETYVKICKEIVKKFLIWQM